MATIEDVLSAVRRAFEHVEVARMQRILDLYADILKNPWTSNELQHPQVTDNVPSASRDQPRDESF